MFCPVSYMHLFVIGILDTEKDLASLEEFATALKVLEEAKLQLPKPGEVLHMC